jgi:thiol-disulfide isomerase/thioredoxin
MSILGTQLKASDFEIISGKVYVKNVTTPGMVLVWAEWCGHCQNFKPIFNQICKDLGNTFACTSIQDTNLENQTALTNALGVSGFPTLKFFDQNGLLSSAYKGGRDRQSMLQSICQNYHKCILKQA